MRLAGSSPSGNRLLPAPTGCPASGRAPDVPTRGLAARSLTFTYGRGAVPVVRDFDRDFPPGVVTALTGPSGCGKSTLLYLLAGMLRAQAGAVYWDGRDVSGVPDAERSRFRASVTGFVFQDAMLDPSRTVVDNVCEAALFAGIRRPAARARARDLLTRFGVEHREDHRPGEISGGQAQRVALCRALLPEPRLVLADEPTGNLDPASADVVWQALTAAAAAGAVVLIATHDPTLAHAADQVVEL